MDIIIEVFDGVAYTVEEAKTSEEACNKCFFADKDCGGWCIQRHSMTTYYRRLTPKECKELQKTIGRGLEGGAKTNGEIDLTKVSAVCRECATAAGCKPKNNLVAAWMDTCDICKERKPCTDLWHDWIVPKEGDEK